MPTEHELSAAIEALSAVDLNGVPLDRMMCDDEVEMVAKIALEAAEQARIKEKGPTTSR